MQVDQRTIVIIEDSPEDSLTLTRYLAGYPEAHNIVHCAESGVKGLNLCKKIKPDCVLLDYHLPDIDGLEVLLALRKEADLNYLPVIMITGQGDEAIAVQAMKQGAQDYLVKSLDNPKPENLHISVQNAIQKRAMQSQLAEQRDELARKNLELQILAEENRLRFLQEQKARAELEAILTAIPDTVIVYDESLSIVQTNANLQTFGNKYNMRLIVERLRLKDIYDEQGNPLMPDQLPEARMLRGEILTGANTMDIRIHTMDGSELQFNTSGAPICDQDGTIIGAVAIQRDVTRRRHLEQLTEKALHALLVLAESLVVPSLPTAYSSNVQNVPPTCVELKQIAELTNTVLGAKRTSIITIDPETRKFQAGVITGDISTVEREFWSRFQGLTFKDSCECLQFPAEIDKDVFFQNLSKEFIQYCSPHDIAILKHWIVVPLHLDTQLVGLMGLDYGEEDEHEHTMEERRLVNAVGKLVAIVVERKRLLMERAETGARELALRDANRRMDEFLGMVSHELRTPLTAIVGNIELSDIVIKALSQAQEMSPEQLARKVTSLQTLLERSKGQLWRLNRLVDDLINVSRIQANKLVLRMEFCDLSTIVNEIVTDQKQVNKERLIMVEIKMVEPVMVLADQDRIGQVITNYLTNAIKYSENDSPIKICLQLDGIYAQVLVFDKGPGLPPEEQERIWESFYRVKGVTPKSASSLGLGLGLGLHICRTIIQQHGGQVGVKSKPGEGSCFWFTLPLASVSQ